ncbi:DoxX family protein [Nocardia gipuzkoensis]|uniref:DoxX family protein n=1 Tax=Nocardia gipuzkoensis TaxID=2749991 RepID=UPI001E38A0CC|nr:DoxX family protein [Nocardia gipuzkoensis]UGT70962.1 DoxX family protein [Nocardia gipuzkoensis]
MNVASVVLALVLAVFFAALGAAKVLAVPSMRERAAHVGYSVTAYRAIGSAEIAGALGLLLGIGWWQFGVAAGIGLVLLLVGAVVVHVRTGDGVREFTPALVSCLLTVAYAVTQFGATR